MKSIQRKLKELYDRTHQGKETNIYKTLIAEEFNELILENKGTANEYKELCDLIWVCIQYANECSYDLDTGMEALKKEYWSKFYTKEGVYEPVYRSDGKLLKNTGFKKANFEELL